MGKPGAACMQVGVVGLRGEVWAGGPACGIEDPSAACPWPCPFLKSRAPWDSLFLSSLVSHPCASASSR